ncbi:hypothetical protein P8452_44372 [Trifolium repens]|nr:hypothetical protein P8452_44372 [Trifolium repens]
MFLSRISPSSRLVSSGSRLSLIGEEKIYIEMTDASFVTSPMRIRKIEQTSIKAGRIYTKMCADIALDYFNSIHDTNFELVEDHENMGSYSFNQIPGTLTHCFFKAKENRCINDFFAEIMHVGPLYPSVVNCKLVTQEDETRVPLQKYPPFVGSSGFHPFKETADEPSFAHVITHPTYHPEPPIAEDYMKMCVSDIIAKRAIDHYNKTNETTFLPVVCDKMRSCSFSEEWIHICFHAKEYYNSRIKLFFAEIKYSRVSMPVVTICRILDGETKVGCENCKLYEVIHPVEGYRAEFLDNMEIVEENRGSWNKVYEEEYLGRIR